MIDVYEKLGLFYLGKDVDQKTQEASGQLTLIKNKSLTTHAAIIGMTGSGKTGLGIGLIEEAAIDNIPSIVIDPKGDMGNLLLTDPTFSAKSFEPWVADEAKSKNENVGSYAKKIAKRWKDGIESHHQTANRVEKFSAVKKTIYTPGSSAGMSIKVLSSMDAPPREIMQDSDSFASYLGTTVSSLLSLIGIEADPIASKEYLLLAQLLNVTWLKGENISLENLIGKIISPPFEKVGMLPLEAFYPQKERFKFAIKFNSILASPTFKAWLEGDDLDIQRFLYDEQGKAKIAIFSIAHLNDNERMFFVTLLLNKYIAWMRTQSGASSLKTLFYMDEILGYFPPTKNPPSKPPMLLLLKQARAFGVGVILSTQNPIDLDYKGLSNIGTWFIGRLQTKQDISRVIDGLSGKSDASFDKKKITSLLNNLKSRTFFLKSNYREELGLFSTRWVLSYLKGPLKRKEISKLMEKYKDTALTRPNNSIARAKQSKAKLNDTGSNDGYSSFINVNSEIEQRFVPNFSTNNNYSAQLRTVVSLNYFNQARGIDLTETLQLSIPLIKSRRKIRWDDAQQNPEEWIELERLPNNAPSSIRYAGAPKSILTDKNLNQTKKDLMNWVYHEKKLDLFRCKKPKMESKPKEVLRDFNVRVSDRLNDSKEIAIDKLKERYSKKEKVLVDRLDRALVRLEKEQGDKNRSFMNAGITVLSALFGRSRASVGRAGTRIMKEQGDIGRAKSRVKKIEDNIDELEIELEEKIDSLSDDYDIDNIAIEEFSIKLRKTDIQVDQLAIVWSADKAH